VRLTFAAIVCALASVGATQKKPPAPPPGPSAAFTQIFDQYRRGNPAPAIGSFARWKPERVSAEARLAEGADDPLSLAALALFHTDAGIANGTFGGFAPKTPNFINLGGWGLESVFEVHSLSAYRIIETLTKRGKETKDEGLLKFCRSWYVVAMSACAKGGEAEVATEFVPKPSLGDGLFPAEQIMKSGGRPDCVSGLRDKAIHYFDDDPEIQLLLGSVIEPKQMTRSRLKNTHIDGSYGQESRWYFKKAYDADPALVEAMVRRGRLLHVGLNEPDAQPLHERAYAEARKTDSTFLAHLAAFFLGQIHEDHHEMDEAIRYYREAVSLIRAHTASIALGQALIRTGQPEEGWLIGSRMFGREGTGAPPIPDPFVLYRYAQYWQIDERLTTMRQMVRQQR